MTAEAVMTPRKKDLKAASLIDKGFMPMEHSGIVNASFILFTLQVGRARFELATS